MNHAASAIYDPLYSFDPKVEGVLFILRAKRVFAVEETTKNLF